MYGMCTQIMHNQGEEQYGLKTAKNHSEAFKICTEVTS